jgi:ATP-dependent Lon protease
VAFSWRLAADAVGSARITTDTGWTVEVDRGLDLFQRFDPGPFSVEQAIQEARLVRGAVLTYSRAHPRSE